MHVIRTMCLFMEEHDGPVHKVSRKLVEADLTLRRDTCRFGMCEVNYLGHNISWIGVALNKALQLELKNAPSLEAFVPGKETMIVTDASSKRLGVVLLQKRDGVDRLF